MASSVPEIMEFAQAGFTVQDVELAAARDRQLRTVVRQTSSGSGNIDVLFGLDRKFRLVFVRGHFVGGAGTAGLAIVLDSGLGSAHDTKLFTVSIAGTGTDVHLRLDGADSQDPSPWTFQPDDRLRVQWTNPDSANMTWGVEVGLALCA
jgi:hypothetical protein